MNQLQVRKHIIDTMLRMNEQYLKMLHADTKGTFYLHRENFKLANKDLNDTIDLLKFSESKDIKE